MDKRRVWIGRGSRLLVLLAAVAVVPACGNGGGSSGPTGNALKFNGGQGTNGDGGNGGYFDVIQYTSSDTKVVRSGTIDTTFVAPSGTPYLGTNPRTVSVSTVLTTSATFSAAPASLTQIIKGATSGTIVGDDGVNPATGLWVQSGVTLSVPPHYDDSDATPATGPFDNAYLNFSYGVLIEGTLQVLNQDLSVENDNASPNGTNLEIDCNNLVVGSGGRIVTSGSNIAAGSGDGGFAGWLYVYSSYTIINRGSIEAMGGNGDNGGSGGSFYAYAYYANVYNLGTVNTSGGQALDPAGVGGYGNWIGLYGGDSGSGGAMNAGTLIGRGGNGPGGGGSADGCYFLANYYGTTLTSGYIDVSGGNATVDGDGGGSGYIEFVVYGGSIRATGTLLANGGNGAGAGDGGDGDSIKGYIYGADDYPESEYNTVLGAYFGATMQSMGGTGANGGAGGYFEIEQYDDNYVSTPGYAPIVIIADAVDISGGNGTVNGGGDYTQYFYITSYPDYSDLDGEYRQGNVICEVDVNANGGNGGTGAGGDAAYWGIETTDEEFGTSPTYDSFVRNTGNVTMKGGDGATNGGAGNSYEGAWIYSYYRIENTGSFDIRGGNGATGGDGGYLDFESDDAMTNSGSINTSGGNGTTGNGGSASSIDLNARRLVSSGAMTANGGNSASATGGDGGDITLLGTDVPSNVTGSATSTGGTGAPAGTGGAIWILGLQRQ